ncbi:MAG: Clp protease N-terminal domain-containing protein [Nocardioides sp.]|uniref:Clp protease N-terminal domain-containing protein n=1 Tax=Nocardioides sp. TaxID=35761 RepID=UPI0039E45DFC
MFDRLTDEARWVVRRGQDHARATSATTIESEHLLVALSEREGTRAQRVLVDAGLTAERLRGLIDQERDRSLRSAGIEPSPIPVSPSASSLALATSAKNVLRRAVVRSTRGKTKGIDATRLLRAVLDQEAGTVPRLLALAEVDQSALLAALGEEDA